MRSATTLEKNLGRTELRENNLNVRNFIYKMGTTTKWVAAPNVTTFLRRVRFFAILRALQQGLHCRRFLPI